MEDLISKKELLEKYGISYGTLYRWKRMGLIPEDWLVKKSTFTGQETFFNRELICRRVEEIMEKKDSVSLEELSKEMDRKSAGLPKLKISTKHGDKVFYLSEVIDITIMSDGQMKTIFSSIENINDFGGKL